MAWTFSHSLPSNLHVSSAPICIMSSSLRAAAATYITCLCSLVKDTVSSRCILSLSNSLWLILLPSHPLSFPYISFSFCSCFSFLFSSSFVSLAALACLSHHRCHPCHLSLGCMEVFVWVVVVFYRQI